MINGYTIIDGHTHTFSTEEVARKIIESFNRIYSIEFENPGTSDTGDILQNMSRMGIDYSIMANFAPAKILDANNLWTLETAAEHARLIPLVSFHPDMPGSIRELLEAYIEKGAKGVKLHPMAQGFDPRDSRLDPLYEGCSHTGLPVVFHCGRVSNARLNEYSDLDTLLPVIQRYPRIHFILTHMVDGNAGAVMRLAQEYGNISFDTSIVITGYPPIMRVNEPSWLNDDEVVDIIAGIGAERVIFGSDYPWGSPGPDARRILGMKLDEHQKRRIFSENAIRVFGLEKIMG